MKGKLLLRIASLLVVCVLFGGMVYQGNQWYYELDRYIGALESEPPVQFLPKDAFVPEDAMLELALPENLASYVDIHYTLDGSTPTPNSPLYSGPIPLNSGGERVCWPVKVILCQGDKQSSVYSRTYFPADTAVLQEDIVIVALSGEPDDFFHPETGILSTGAATPEEAFADPDIPLSPDGLSRGNYYGRGREWERPVMVEMYNAQGLCVLQQQAGVRVTGGYSRGNPQKSLRLYARAEYDPEHGKFPTDIFGAQVSVDGSNTPIEEFNHLDLRNGGQDWYYTMLGDVAVRALAANAGFAPVGLAKPAVVYLNGAYYGLVWMQPDYCDKNIAEMCNLLNEESIQVVGTMEGNATSEDDPTAGVAYDEMYALALQDLTQPQNARALENVLDIDNFLLYYALEMYCNNQDWPQNNYKLWRYTGADEWERQTNPYADGRWRFLLYDTDGALYSTPVDTADGFDWAYGLQQSPMLVNMLQNKNYLNRFLNIWCYLLSTALGPQAAQDTIELYKTIIAPEMMYRYEQDPQHKIFDPELVDILYLKMEAYLERRPDEIFEKLKEYFDVEQMYTLRVDAPNEGGAVSLDALQLPAGEMYSGSFYTQADLVLQCRPAAGYRVVGWNVNGETRVGSKLVLQGVEEGETVTVCPLLQPVSGGGVLLSALMYRSDTNWAEVQNYGRQEVPLNGYYLTKNDEEEPLYYFPSVVLGQGQSLRILEDEGLTTEDIGNYVGAFDLRKGDVLRLHNAQGQVLDEIRLPPKHPNMVYRRSLLTSGWIWENGEGAGDG